MQPKRADEKTSSLNGHSLTLWQRCPRQFLLESSARYLPHHPTTLFNACLRALVHSLSQPSADKHLAVTSAVNRFMTNSKYPGLALPAGLNPYTLATDYTACLRTVGEYVSRLRPKPLTYLPPASFHGVSWTFLSPVSSDHVLHRWKAVSSTSDDTVRRELHTWEVYADLCLSKLPMVLHLVNIGRREGSHRITPWCRAYKSATIAKVTRFQKTTGASLDPSWKPFFFSSNPDNDPEMWVDLMETDRLFDETNLIRHVTIDQPSKTHRANFEMDFARLTSEIIAAVGRSFVDEPISRPACDEPYPCVHQAVCYSERPVEALSKSKLYEIRSDGGK